MFAPVYRPSEGQQSLLTRKDKQRKRKRGQEDISSSGDEEPLEAEDSKVDYRSVNRKDPYHIAGWTREAPLPPAPFPHAAVPSRQPPKPVEEELAELNPPLYVSKAQPDGRSTSLKRSHVDNLTTVLHTCMLRGDWQRAARAWGLLLRTEIAGRGIDVRQQGRWGIGAELLMRRKVDVHGEERDKEDEVPFSDEGFKLAREYYERLILQYPHTPRTQQTINALAFYPALFNIWIYEVQDRSQRARRRASTDRRAQSLGSDASAESSSASVTRNEDIAVRQRELDEALPIAQRMDELLLSPPYDSSLPLMQLRGMVGLWLSDLYTQTVKSKSSSDDDEGSDVNVDDRETRQSLQQSHAERRKALDVLQKVKAAGGELPQAIADLLESIDDERSE